MGWCDTHSQLVPSRRGGRFLPLMRGPEPLKREAASEAVRLDSQGNDFGSGQQKNESDHTVGVLDEAHDALSGRRLVES